MSDSVDEPQAIRVLVVDDAHLNRLILQRDLERAGYEVVLAEDGERALAIIDEQAPFNLVVLDIVLPEMSGIEVLRLLRERYSMIELPIIMASGRRSADDVVEALDEGANDYVTKPLNMTVVMARVRVQLQNQALERRLQQRNHEIELARDHLQADLDAAARIQGTLLQHELPLDSSCWYACFNQPCTTVGGDIYNVIKLDDTHRAVYLIDVSGHGVQAALLAVSLFHMLSAQHGSSPLIESGFAGEQPVEPLMVARNLNRQFQISRANMQYFTMIYGVLHEVDGVFDYVLAGHPPPILVLPDGSVDQPEAGSMPIGLMPDDDFITGSVQLQPGARLFIHSDGITEAEDVDGEQYGTDQLRRCLRRGMKIDLQGSLDLIVQEVRRWSHHVDQQDDYSIVAMEMKA